jgi:hypothetical protein
MPTSVKEPIEHRDNDGLHKRRGVWYYCLTIGGIRRFFSTKMRNYTEARKVRSKAIKAQLENRLPTDAAKQRFEALACTFRNLTEPGIGKYFVLWSGRGDLNARPPAPKAGALPGCATPRHLKLL